MARAVFDLYRATFGKCAECMSAHPVWPAREHHLEYGDLGLDPMSVEMVLEVLAAAGGGSPGCNKPRLRICVESSYQAMADMRMGWWGRRSYRKQRQSGQAPMLAHAEALYLFLCLTLKWSFEYAERTNRNAAQVLEDVTDTANRAAVSIPEPLREASESLLIAAVNTAPEHGEGLDGLFSALALSCRMLERLSFHLPGSMIENQVSILLAAGNYALCAGALISGSD